MNQDTLDRRMSPPAAATVVNTIGQRTKNELLAKKLTELIFQSRNASNLQLSSTASRQDTGNNYLSDIIPQATAINFVPNVNLQATGHNHLSTVIPQAAILSNVNLHGFGGEIDPTRPALPPPVPSFQPSYTSPYQQPQNMQQMIQSEVLSILSTIQKNTSHGIEDTSIPISREPPRSLERYQERSSSKDRYQERPSSKDRYQERPSSKGRYRQRSPSKERYPEQSRSISTERRPKRSSCRSERR